MKRCYAILLLAVLFFATMQGMDTGTRIFDTNFRSLQVYPANNDMAPPIITLASDEQVVVTFDELTPEMQYLRYRVIHCNADWQPSHLVESEYLDGFNLGDVTDYAYSTATLTQYVNYRIVLPNADFQFTKSGNYLLQVFPENDPDKVLLQARFYVTEGEFSVNPMVTSRTDIDYNRHHQQVSVRVAARDRKLRNWWDDMTLVVMQNMRPETEVVLRRPNLIEPVSVSYEHQQQLIFPAGNEYRRFETVASTYPGMSVESITFDNPFYHIKLKPDESRVYSTYVYDQTQHGRYRVRHSGAGDSSVEAEYVVVHFALNVPEMTGGEMYVAGDFNNGTYDTANRMHYDSERGCYVADMLLKMGSYNYMYVWVPDGTSVADIAKIEGNHYQTVNLYTALVYYRAPGERYDRLMGYGITFSGK